MPLISSSPWMVPSSPYAPCSTGKTTSRPIRSPVPSRRCRPRPLGSPTSVTGVPPATSGSSPSTIASRCPGSVSTQPPSRVMPTGTTSYRSGSSAARTAPAETQEMGCSALGPPKTTALRRLPACPLIAADPSRGPPPHPDDGQDGPPAPGCGNLDLDERSRNGDDLPRAAPGGGRRPPLHRDRLGARAAHRAGRVRRRRGDRPVAGPGGPRRRRHRRDAGPPAAGQGNDPLVRRRPARRHRRLPHLRLRAGGAAVDDRIAARRGRGVGRRRAAAAGLLLPVLPGRREDRGPRVPGLPELLERGRLLRHRPRSEPGGRGHGARRVLGAGVRAGALPLPVADDGAARAEPGADGGLAGRLRRPAGADARPAPGRGRAVAGLPRVLRRGQPVADRAGGPPPAGGGRRGRLDGKTTLPPPLAGPARDPEGWPFQYLT